MVSPSVLRWCAIATSCVLAFFFRIHAVAVFGRVIHEFDPWFNYRATEYLAEHGWHKFFTWFDYMSWYPLGRPVGTTIYPGMQFTAVALWRVLDAVGWPMTLNDVCVFMPAWFGVLATLLTGLLAKECCGCANVGAVACVIMSIIPAHLMRSPAGKYDNECVAMAAMVGTFYLWVRSLRTPRSWPIGAAAGLAYFYMVAAWGGYIFVVNMVGLHALLLTVCGRYSANLHRAYTLFFVVGTAGAVCVPPVGWAPLRSLEQMLPLAVCCLLQVFAVCEALRVRWKLTEEQAFDMRVRAVAVGALGGAALVALIWPTGYFGPLSSRVRSLFIPHTRTGNPLVDSVAEHQATSVRAYWQFLHMTAQVSPVGLVLAYYRLRNSDAGLFIILYAVVTYYFSQRMNRLLLLLGPVCSVLAAYAIVIGAQWARTVLQEVLREAQAEVAAERKGRKPAPRAAPRPKRGRQPEPADDPMGELQETWAELDRAYGLRRIGACLVAVTLPFCSYQFFRHSDMMAQAMSQPSIMRLHRSAEGSFIIDDYREGYWWLRDNTPEDSRVMAWWDYGYQIAGVANRTTIADGNTWNHEHIATIGRCLTSPERKAHKIIRHLADYVLIWAGGGGDDLAKSPHMARIGNSVYNAMCPGDPTCKQYGFVDGDREKPTPMMANSLLFKLHGHGIKEGVHVNETLFKEVFKSKHGLVRIYKVRGVSKESKEWVADPANRKCDAPGSWYCEGQYPPALEPVIRERKSFAQLEDFNRRRDEEAEEYQREYHKRMREK